MKKNNYSLAYIQALQSYARFMSQARIRKATNVIGTGNTVSSVESGNETYAPENVIIADYSLFKNLSTRALKLMGVIMEDLQFNNALWFFDHTTSSRDYKVIQELRKKGVLFPTEDTRIHYVNPDMIRKGNKLLVAANTAAITATGKVERAMIRPLNKKNIQINPMHLTELTQ